MFSKTNANKINEKIKDIYSSLENEDKNDVATKFKELGSFLFDTYEKFIQQNNQKLNILKTKINNLEKDNQNDPELNNARKELVNLRFDSILTLTLSNSFLNEITDNNINKPNLENVYANYLEIKQREKISEIQKLSLPSDKLQDYMTIQLGMECFLRGTELAVYEDGLKNKLLEEEKNEKNKEFNQFFAQQNSPPSVDEHAEKEEPTDTYQEEEKKKKKEELQNAFEDIKNSIKTMMERHSDVNVMLNSINKKQTAIFSSNANIQISDFHREYQSFLNINISALTSKIQELKLNNEGFQTSIKSFESKVEGLNISNIQTEYIQITNNTTKIIKQMEKKLTDLNKKSTYLISQEFKDNITSHIQSTSDINTYKIYLANQIIKDYPKELSKLTSENINTIKNLNNNENDTKLNFIEDTLKTQGNHKNLPVPLQKGLKKFQACNKMQEILIANIKNNIKDSTISTDKINKEFNNFEKIISKSRDHFAIKILKGLAILISFGAAALRFKVREKEQHETGTPLKWKTHGSEIASQVKGTLFAKENKTPSTPDNKDNNIYKKNKN